MRRGTEAAGAEVLASRFGRDSVRLALIGQLANEYLALRSHDAQLEVTRQALESRQESLKIVQARVDGGVGLGPRSGPGRKRPERRARASGARSSASAPCPKTRSACSPASPA
jgi:hypothetical protein